MAPHAPLARRLLGLLVLPVALGALTLGTATQAAADEPGPRMASKDQARHAALRCVGDPVASKGAPVLLVHGTALTAAENWGTTYLPALTAEGRAVCTVSLPDQATGDLQTSVEYVATAIRDLSDRAGRKVSVIGHSQGALLPRIALRTWPDLARRVDDVIGLAGVYDNGSAELVSRCATECVPAMQQMATGSQLLGSVGVRRLPKGPSYTNIGSLGDQTVTPQPAANQQRGAHAVEIQDVCPGRTIPLNEHGLIIGDAAAKALVDDALGHRGTAKAGRVPAGTCAQVYYAGFVPNPFIEAAPFVKERLVATTDTEPALRCFLRADCSDVDARGRLLVRPQLTTGPDSLVVRGRSVGRGEVRVLVGDRAVVRQVEAGRFTIRVDRNPGDDVMVETRPRYFSAWGAEAGLVVA